MAAHEKNVEDRNGDFWRIVEELEAGGPRFRKKKQSKLKSKGEKTGVKLFDDVDHVFWCGDLNYRLECSRSLIEEKVRELHLFLR